MNTKKIGGILLVAGTCIGGGMLGLPIATAKGGIMGASLLFIFCWMLMTFTALLTLEVNTCFPLDSNIFSMAKTTLGKPGEFICWTIYLLFLYALVAAYIAGGQDVLHGLLVVVGLDIPIWCCTLLFVGLFGSIVMAGVKQVDVLNRLLMLIKFFTIFGLMFAIAYHVNQANYIQGKFRYLLPAVTVSITSFGFSIIVPSLRSYFNSDIKTLREVILIGSLLPLICYILWDAVIFGLVPLTGEFGLERLLLSHQPVTGLLMSINHFISTDFVILLARMFTSICVLTAFACVSLGLSDYLADGMKVEKQGRNRLIVTGATFLPPVLVVLFYPAAFILLLSLAGVCCLVLQAFMPALMAWRCRYVAKLEGQYQVFGGKPFLFSAMLISCCLTLVAIYQIV